MSISARQSTAATVTDSAEGYCWLQNYSAIRVSGRDTYAFLNRQLTCELEEVTLERAGFGAWCSSKGRVITLLRLIKRPDALYLLMPSELCEYTLQRLRMFVLRDDVVFESECDDPLGVLGLMGEEAAACLENFSGLPMPVKTYQTVHGNGLSIVRWPGACTPRLVVLGTHNDLEGVLLSTARPLPQCTFNHWQLQDIRAGIADITVPTRESFIPQMLNLERVSGVSFTKGCYPGQEIVARTQHLGRIKRRMFIGRLEHCARLPEAGSNLVSDKGENVAVIVTSAAIGDGGCELLAVIPLAKAAQALYLEQATSAARSPVQLEEPAYGFEDPA